MAVLFLIVASRLDHSSGRLAVGERKRDPCLCRGGWEDMGLANWGEEEVQGREAHMHARS